MRSCQQSVVSGQPNLTALQTSNEVGVADKFARVGKTWYLIQLHAHTQMHTYRCHICGRVKMDKG